MQHSVLETMEKPQHGINHTLMLVSPEGSNVQPDVIGYCQRVQKGRQRPAGRRRLLVGEGGTPTWPHVDVGVTREIKNTNNIQLDVVGCWPEREGRRRGRTLMSVSPAGRKHQQRPAGHRRLSPEGLKTPATSNWTSLVVGQTGEDADVLACRCPCCQRV
jgi:hypothetical protein